MTCERCGHRNPEGVLRCEACDAWLDGGHPREPGLGGDGSTRRLSGPAAGAQVVPEKPPTDGTQPLASRVPGDLHPRCPGCGEDVGLDWRFCQACGTPLHTSPHAPVDRAAPTVTRLKHVLVELDLDGLQVRRSHELDDGTTVVGRVDGDIRVPGDAAMSTRHAAFRVEGRRCLLRDLGSTNGTFVAITRGEALRPGSVLLAGSQRLLLRSRREDDGERSAELVQVLPLGHSGRTMRLDKDTVVIGKSSRADFSFPEDHYLSRNHCEVVHTSRGLVVRDLGSTNRTYLIVQDERPLEDGDRIVLGEQLFEYRVEEA